MKTPELEPAPPHTIGPTWRRLKSGGFWLPEKSLGYGIVNWLYEYVKQPNGPAAGEPFIPTNEQFRFLLWWYAVDERGRFAYRNGVLRRLKGWGKDPLVAAMSLAELCGPVAFGGWDSNGQPIGVQRSAAWIQIAAVSQDQTRNTFSLFPAMVSQKLKETFSVETHRTLVYSEGGGIIEAVTSSPLAMEGKRPTFVVKNETQWWLETNSGHEMANVIAGNVDKAAYGSCRALSICNAHRPGEESDAEQDWDAYQAIEAGDALDNGLLYDALEAPADTPVSEIADYDPSLGTTDEERAELQHKRAELIDKLREGLNIARGDAIWLDLDNLVASILDIKNDVIESRRKFLNQINAAEDSWIAPREWDALSDPTLKLAKRERITLGFDGSKGNDHTALVACRVEDGALFLIKAWNPERYDGNIPREQVNQMVEHCFEKYDVVGFRADVREFESYIDQWAVKFGKKLKVKATPKHSVGFDMRGNTKVFTLDCEKFKDAVIERELNHNGDPKLRQYVLNAHSRFNTHGESISKATKDSSRKIDGAVCAVLAYGARQEFLMKHNRRKGAVILR